jgi:WD40 repeat protein
MNKIILLLIVQFILSTAYSQAKDALVSFPTDDAFIYGICFTSHGEALGIADNKAIKVYATNTRSLLHEFKNGHRDRILSIDISRDSTLLVSGGKDSTIVLWDLITGIIKKTFRCHSGIVTSVKISPDGRYILSGGTDKKICLYDIAADHLVKEFDEHTNDVTRVAFSPDGKLIGGAGGDKIITIYNLKNGNLIATLAGHRSWVRDISFSQNGTKVISCGDDSRIITWDISDINNIHKLNQVKKGHCWLLSLDNIDDGRTYVIGDVNGNAQIVSSFGIYRARIGVPITRILFEPNNGILVKIAVASGGKGVLLADARNLKISQK